MSNNTPAQDAAILEIQDGLEILQERARDLGMNMATFIGTLHIFTQYMTHRAYTDPIDEEIH